MLFLITILTQYYITSVMNDNSFTLTLLRFELLLMYIILRPVYGNQRYSIYTYRALCTKLIIFLMQIERFRVLDKSHGN